MNPTYRDLVSVHMMYTFREVVDVVMIVEHNFLATQKETQTQAQSQHFFYLTILVLLFIVDLKEKVLERGRPRV